MGLLSIVVMEGKGQRYGKLLILTSTRIYHTVYLLENWVFCLDLYMQNLVPPHLYQALDARTDYMESPRFPILKPTNHLVTFAYASNYAYSLIETKWNLEDILLLIQHPLQDT